MIQTSFITLIGLVCVSQRIASAATGAAANQFNVQHQNTMMMDVTLPVAQPLDPKGSMPVAQPLNPKGSMPVAQPLYPVARPLVVRQSCNQPNTETSAQYSPNQKGPFPDWFGCNNLGMPHVLANSLALMVATTIPTQQYFGSDPQIFQEVHKAWHQWNEGIPNVRDGFTRTPEFRRMLHQRRKQLQACELGIFYSIELRLISGDGDRKGNRISVHAQMRNGFRFQFRENAELGWYPEPTDPSKNVSPFSLEDQWRLAHDYLTLNGWALTETGDWNNGRTKYAVYRATRDLLAAADPARTVPVSEASG